MTDDQTSPVDEFAEQAPQLDGFAPDTPEEHAPADFPPPPLQMQPPPAGGPWETLPEGMPPDAAGPAAPKKRTGLIIAIVIGVLVLMCGCGVAIVGLLIGLDASGNSGTSSTAPATPEDAQRIAKWLEAQASFPTTGFTTFAPEARQQQLAEQATAMLLPDFTVDDLRVHPGTFDSEKNWYGFDTYVTRLRLKSDRSVTLLFAYDVGTTEADAAGLSKDDIQIGDGDLLVALPGGTWLIYVADSRKPLFGGIKDPTYVDLLKQAETDWPGGDVSMVTDMSDGGVNVHVYTLQSYAGSSADDYIECVYRKKDGVWALDSYDVITGTDTGQEPVPSET
jgi:hypothetical protein